MHRLTESGFKIEALDQVVAPDAGLCADILEAAANGGTVANGFLGLVTLGGWGWVLLVCFAGQA